LAAKLFSGFWNLWLSAFVLESKGYNEDVLDLWNVIHGYGCELPSTFKNQGQPRVTLKIISLPNQNTASVCWKH